MSAVRAGLGLTQTFKEYCQRDLDAGRLEAVLEVPGDLACSPRLIIKIIINNYLWNIL